MYLTIERVRRQPTTREVGSDGKVGGRDKTKLVGVEFDMGRFRLYFTGYCLDNCNYIKYIL